MANTNQTKPMTKRQYVSITETRSIVIAVDGTENSASAVFTVMQAYRNGEITLNDKSNIVEDQTTIRNETADWQRAVSEGYDDSHFLALGATGR